MPRWSSRTIKGLYRKTKFQYGVFLLIVQDSLVPYQEQGLAYNAYVNTHTESSIVNCN